MNYKRIPVDTFKKLQVSAGVICSAFDTSTATVNEDDIIGATTGGVTFQANCDYTDYGEDIDNCPKNTKELKKRDQYNVTLSGTMVTVDTAVAKTLIASATVSGTKVTPNADLAAADFDDIWLVGDYSDKNDGATGGYIAIHILNALSTGGFQLKTADKDKGQFAFVFTGHYSVTAQDTVPFEVYIKAGT